VIGVWPNDSTSTDPFHDFAGFLFAIVGLVAIANGLVYYVGDVSGSWRYPLIMAFVGVGLMAVRTVLEAVGSAWPQQLAPERT
jgi:tellurite resistance protein TehA-like permease